MDSSLQPPLETNEPVHVTVLGKCETKFLGRITNVTGRSIALVTDQPAPLGAAVKLEWTDTLLLGEVCYCRTEGVGFALGLDLEHALYNTLELARLAKLLLDDVAPQKERRGKEIRK